jgi:hypothetical protein
MDDLSGTRRRIAVSTVAIWLLVGAVSAGAQNVNSVVAGSSVRYPGQAEDTARYRIDVDAAVYELRVFDERGASVMGLRGDDFSVMEAGKPRPLVYFEEIRSRPFSLAILLDVGSGMSAAHVREGKGLIFDLIHLLDPGDEIVIGLFAEVGRRRKRDIVTGLDGGDETVAFLSPLTRDRSALLRAIENIPVGERPRRISLQPRPITPPGSGGPAAALGIDFSASNSQAGRAVDEALIELSGVGCRDRAVLLISAGSPNLGDGTLDHLERAGAALFVVSFDFKIGGLLDLGFNRAGRRKVTRKTAGIEYSPADVAERIRENLGHSYLIAFEPKDSKGDGEPRVAFEVRDREDLSVTAARRSAAVVGEWWRAD